MIIHILYTVNTRKIKWGVFRKSFVFFWLVFGALSAKTQEVTISPTSEIDSVTVDTVSTKKFVDKSDKLLVSAGFLLKSYNIKIENVGTGKSIAIDPTGSVNLGFGVNYKWLGLAFSFGLPTPADDKRKLGETQKQDYQLNVYSNAFVAQGHLQYYKGFHISEIDDGDTSKIKVKGGEGIIPSLETYSLGLSAWYFFNHKKFSYKAAYLRNAIQTKSAGSPVVGLYYGLDKADATATIGESLPDSIKNQFDVLGYRSQTFGISIGYSYTLVIKRFFVNGTIVPGIGLKNVSLTTKNETFFIEEGITGRLVFNLAFGYDAKHFLIGLRAFTSSRFFEVNGLRFNTGTNSLTLFVGKRFNVGKGKKNRKNSK